MEDHLQQIIHFKRKNLNLSPFANNYTLRENPKKTWRIGEDSMDSQSSETTVIEHMIPSRRRRSERKNRYGSDTHQELEEVAMCLIMMSRDKNRNMFDLSDSNSGFGDDPDRNMTKVASLKDLKEKNTRFECTTCNKMFDSYQALGGHRASHRKSNVQLLLASPELAEEAAKSQSKRRNKKRDSKSDNHHECPICFKVFQSGQALGGHKRSHLLASEGKNRSQASVVENPVPETQSFLDLNLPAPTEDEEEESCNTVGTFKLHQPWWIGASLKHETAISLIAN